MEPLTIGEVIAALQRAKPAAIVQFDFCGCVPTEVDSWRGIYAEPALGWRPYSCEKGHARADAVLKNLRDAVDGRLFGGWKGGEFRFTKDSPLHVDNRGEYTNTHVVAVSVETGGEWVYIITEHDAAMGRRRLFGRRRWRKACPMTDDEFVTHCASIDRHIAGRVERTIQDRNRLAAVLAGVEAFCADHHDAEMDAGGKWSINDYAHVTNEIDRLKRGHGVGGSRPVPHV